MPEGGTLQVCLGFDNVKMLTKLIELENNHVNIKEYKKVIQLVPSIRMYVV